VLRVDTSGFADFFRAGRITVLWVMTSDNDTLVGAAIVYTGYVITIEDAL
jgi:hypothetical protein